MKKAEQKKPVKHGTRLRIIRDHLWLISRDLKESGKNYEFSLALVMEAYNAIATALDEPSPFDKRYD